MEKLIELLNEYVKSIKALWEWTVDEYNCIHYNDIWLVTSELRIISKWYWFIEWLVENEKIDRDKVDDKFERPFFWYTNYEIVLMLLSIQDEPIEFLVSILK